MPTKKYKST